MNFLAYAIQNYTYSGHDIMLYRSSYNVLTVKHAQKVCLQ
jgi:hypothetical protein